MKNHVAACYHKTKRKKLHNKNTHKTWMFIALQGSQLQKCRTVVILNV